MKKDVKKSRAIDAHCHFWSLSDQAPNTHPWLQDEKSDQGFLGDYNAICRDYLIPNYREDTKKSVEIKKTVHIQAGWSHTNPLGETEWLQSQYDEHSHPHAIIAYADLTDKNLAKLLSELVQYQNTRGIRQIVSYHPKARYSGCSTNFLETRAWAEGYKKLADYGLSFDLQVYPFQMKDFFDIAKQHERIPFVIEHCGLPLRLEDKKLEQWECSLKQLSQLPHAHIKLSGLGMLGYHWQGDDPWIKRILLTCLDIFGIDRCLFGSNFPVELLYTTPDKLMRAFESIMGFLSADELDKFFYRNALKFYRLST